MRVKKLKYDILCKFYCIFVLNISYYLLSLIVIDIERVLFCNISYFNV